MNDLKEYTIKVSKKGDSLVKWTGGEFLVVEVYDEKDRKYSAPKLKKDGGMTVAYEQLQKVNPGDTITISVEEKKKTNKDGQEYTTRTIKMVKSDEHGVPYVAQPVGDFEARLSKVEKDVEFLKAVNESGSVAYDGEKIIGTNDINSEDLPF